MKQKRVATQLQRLARIHVSSRLTLRLTGSYAVFQLLNLICMALAVVLSACVLAFIFALRGQAIDQLLPWFLIMAIPLWLGSSYWLFKVLVRYGILFPELIRTSMGPVNDGRVDEPEPGQGATSENETSPGLSSDT